MFSFLKGKPAASDKRTLPRRRFSYYMRVTEADTEQILGHLTDINDIGFRLDCRKALPIDREFRLRMELTPEISGDLYINFAARCRWVSPDPLEPDVFNVGFELTKMGKREAEIYHRLVEKYGQP